MTALLLLAIASARKSSLIISRESVTVLLTRTSDPATFFYKNSTAKQRQHFPVLYVRMYVPSDRFYWS